MTPLLCPVWCAATSASRSSTTTDASRFRSSRATASPMIPPPTTTASHRCGSSTMPTARVALVGPAEERERRAEEDAQIEERRAMLHVPDVEVYPLRPRQLRAAVDLRPPRDAGLDLQAPALMLVVPLDLVAERRSRADHAHVTAQHVPELGQLVE